MFTTFRLLHKAILFGGRRRSDSTRPIRRPRLVLEELETRTVPSASSLASPLSVATPLASSHLVSAPYARRRDRGSVRSALVGEQPEQHDHRHRGRLQRPEHRQQPGGLRHGMGRLRAAVLQTGERDRRNQPAGWERGLGPGNQPRRGVGARHRPDGQRPPRRGKLGEHQRSVEGRRIRRQPRQRGFHELGRLRNSAARPSTTPAAAGSRGSMGSIPIRTSRSWPRRATRAAKWNGLPSRPTSCPWAARPCPSPPAAPPTASNPKAPGPTAAAASAATRASLPTRTAPSPTMLARPRMSLTTPTPTAASTSMTPMGDRAGTKSAAPVRAPRSGRRSSRKPTNCAARTTPSTPPRWKRRSTPTPRI